MWTSKATIPPIKIRLAALKVALADAADGRVGRLQQQLEIAVHDLDTLLAAYYDQVRYNATAIEIIRTLSDNPATENARCSGRTARLALRALIALSAGHDVAVVGLNVRHALEMKLKIERNAMKWHIPYDGGMYAPRESRGERAPMVRAFTPDEDRSGFRGVVLVDHAVIERMEAVAGVGPVVEEVV